MRLSAFRWSILFVCVIVAKVLGSYMVGGNVIDANELSHFSIATQLPVIDVIFKFNICKKFYATVRWSIISIFLKF